MTVPTKTLPSGDELPTIGFGTWELEGETVKASVEAALEAGYTHIDTAEGYMNEEEIGEVLADADVDRDDLFLTSKVLAKNLHYDDVIASCKESLEKLGTDYLDLYLIHWPNPAISLRETMHAMERLHEEGLVRNVGVSNFSAYQLSAAHHVSDVPIAVNQIEFHPWLQRPDLVDYCRETDTVIEAAAPLGRTDVFGDEAVQELAEEYDKLPAQIVLRWAVDRDVVVLPRSTSPAHIEENFDLFDWELSDDDRQRLDERDRNRPVYDTPARDWDDEVWGIPE
ncbi:aldo/keto reductase [Halopiger xanaduensis]|uniref:2,5-didehydrogluconate reductase n=1 Tax=Halopiger xanaduensis (strain DSM 18323 / JCM 14033 / SH-6) TaxID=797210 RepID=F8D507_HALXS|nr:aldo/keto reductase [Halopiger xanaduensis]AEH38770.1 2,5-didehydrogluconate reductase [Halopiger xanaduensis SH-6]